MDATKLKSKCKELWILSRAIQLKELKQRHFLNNWTPTYSKSKLNLSTTPFLMKTSNIVWWTRSTAFHRMIKSWRLRKSKLFSNQCSYRCAKTYENGHYLTSFFLPSKTLIKNENASHITELLSNSTFKKISSWPWVQLIHALLQSSLKLGWLERVTALV
jgi:hypothetical protein